MKPLKLFAAGLLLLMGCATPSGTHRDWYGFRNQPSESQAQQVTGEEDSPARREYPQRWESLSGRSSAVVEVPEWVFVGYAPWYPVPVPYCRPAYDYWYWRWGWYPCYGCYPPPRVVVVVPPVVREEPLERVRTFGPARGNPPQREGTETSGEGGGRSRGKKAGKGDGTVEVRTSPKETQTEGGGRGRQQGHEMSTTDTDTGGGGRSRGRP